MQLNACETNIMLNDVHVAVSLQISTRPQVLCMFCIHFIAVDVIIMITFDAGALLYAQVTFENDRL